MRYPRELIEEIRMQNDIVDVISQYVPLKQKGSSYFCREWMADEILS